MLAGQAGRERVCRKHSTSSGGPTVDRHRPWGQTPAVMNSTIPTPWCGVMRLRTISVGFARCDASLNTSTAPLGATTLLGRIFVTVSARGSVRPSPRVIRMTLTKIQEELHDIKRGLDRLETSGAPKAEIAPLRVRIAAIEKHLGIDKQIAA